MRRERGLVRDHFAGTPCGAGRGCLRGRAGAVSRSRPTFAGTAASTMPTSIASWPICRSMVCVPCTANVATPTICSSGCGFSMRHGARLSGRPVASRVGAGHGGSPLQYLTETLRRSERGVRARIRHFCFVASCAARALKRSPAQPRPITKHWCTLWFQLLGRWEYRHWLNGKRQCSSPHIHPPPCPFVRRPLLAKRVTPRPRRHVP